MKRGEGFVVLDGPLGWSDHYEIDSTVVELDGYMIADLHSYRDGLFASMLTLFEEQAPMRIAAICSALEALDFEQLKHQAHELAGGATYVGAASLAAHARAIETLAKDANAGEAAPLVLALEKHAGRSIEALRVVLAELEEETRQ